MADDKNGIQSIFKIHIYRAYKKPDLPIISEHERSLEIFAKIFSDLVDMSFTLRKSVIILKRRSYTPFLNKFRY